MTTVFNTASQYDDSCIVQAKWDYATVSDSNKFSSEFQAYKLLTPYKILDPNGNLMGYSRSVITSKNKIRGRGNALSLNFRSEPGKSMTIYGWGIPYTGNTDV